MGGSPTCAGVAAASLSGSCSDKPTSAVWQKCGVRLVAPTGSMRCTGGANCLGEFGGDDSYFIEVDAAIARDRNVDAFAPEITATPSRDNLRFRRVIAAGCCKRGTSLLSTRDNT